MKPPSAPLSQTEDLFRSRLENIIDRDHALVRVGELIPWTRFEKAFGAHYSERRGAPGKAIRLMVGLQLLKHMHGLSDEKVV